ncbi:glycosyltransferase family 2 protein [Vulgatibacter sp.]|uniref:glycosyltransferase family 2 protein n=1 Tax=Vulgatibacter sp. TaxID=1971226 RepID=UPI003567F9C3
MAGPRLSAVVMCFNEKRVIGRCLDALAFCDEIVVVDDCSTDGTWELLQQRADVRPFQHRHTTFAAQRQYGKDRATGDWILTMDADETVTPALARRIRETIARADAADVYEIRRINPYPRTLDGHFWTKHPRLVRAEKCRWVVTDDPHSPLDTQGLRVAILEGAHLDHEPLPDVATMLRKNINRSLIVAALDRSKGREGGLLSLLGSSLGRFFKYYVREGAWRFGADGLIFAAACGFEAFAKQAFLVERQDRPLEQMQDGGPGSYPAGTTFVSGKGEKAA